MPKVTRTNTSFFATPTFRFIAALVAIVLLSMAAAVYLGYSDKGAIDINKKIAGTNQDGFANKVNQLSGNSNVNGGLHPTGDAPQPTPIEPAPTPAPEATTTASSTPLHAEASTTVGLKKR